MDSQIQLRQIKPRAKYEQAHFTLKPWLVYTKEEHASIFARGITLDEAYEKWAELYYAHRKEAS